jgi:SAM-dependent methyltransferase
MEHDKERDDAARDEAEHGEAGRDEEELCRLDARLSSEGPARWDRFYADRARPVPFFGRAPDESLDEWLRAGRLDAGRALDLGCGNGRNAIALAQRGWRVQAVDQSPSAVAWAREETAMAAVDVAVSCESVFKLRIEPGAYDLVYDSGCFHHIAPHRRAQYVALVCKALRPGGAFGLVCFAPEGGSGLSDAAVYEHGSLGGGLGYSADGLRAIWSGRLEIMELRRMRAQDAASALFGQEFLWVMLAFKR